MLYELSEIEARCLRNVLANNEWKPKNYIQEIDDKEYISIETLLNIIDDLDDVIDEQREEIGRLNCEIFNGSSPEDEF